MVELILTCHGASPPHEFKRQFPDPVDWKVVVAALKVSNPRCELHPEYWFDPNCDWE
jgi:hypothetical protein